MKRWGRIALYALAAAALLVVAAVLFLQTRWFRDRLRDRIVWEIETATGGRVELAAFDFRWRGLEGEARGLVLHGTEGPGEAPLFRARSVRAGLKLVSVFERKVDIQSLTLEAPEINVIVYPDGRTNLPTPKAARQPLKNPIEVILDLAVRRFNVVNGTFRAGIHSLPLDARGEDLMTHIVYEATGQRYRGEVSFRGLAVPSGPAGAFPLDVDARLALDRKRLEVTSLRVAMNGSRLEAKGALEGFVSPRVELEYSAVMAVKDIAPALAFDALSPRGSVKLAGRASLAPGGYAVSGALRANGLALRHRGVRVENIAVAAEVALTPEKLELRDLVVSALRGRLAGRAELRRFEDFSVTAHLTGFSLDELTRVPGAPRVAWSGVLSGPIRVSARLRKGKAEDLEAAGKLALTPDAGPHPLEGLLEASYSQRTGRLELAQSWLATPSTRIQFAGTLGQRLELDLHTRNLSDFEPALAMLSEKAPPSLPLRLENGEASFRGSVSGPLEDPQVQGRLGISQFVLEGRALDWLEGSIAVSQRQVRIDDLVLRKRRMRLSGSVRADLRNWTPEPEQAVSGSLSLRAPDLAELLAETGQKLPASGDLTAAISLSGSVSAPQATGGITVLRGVAYEEPFDRLEAQARYSQGLLEISSATVQLGPGRVEAAGAFRPARQDWRQGNLQLDVSAKGVQLGRLHVIQERSPGLEGQIEGRLTGALELAPAGLRVSAVNGQLRAGDLAVEKTPIGTLLFTAVTGGRSLSLNLTGMLAGSAVHGTSQCTLEGNYPAQGTIEFGRLDFAALRARLGPQQRRPELPFHGFLAGKIAFSGSALEPPTWRATIDLPTVEIVPRLEGARLAPGTDLTVRNRGPVRVEADWKGATIRKAEFVGQHITVWASGDVTFRAKAPWNLRLQGAVNLAVLRNLDPEVSSSGQLSLDAVFRGPLDQPEVYGRAEIQDGTLYLSGFPNGLDKISAVAFLYRDRATLERFSAESGGGKVSVSGFIGFGAPVTYHLQARAEQVRYRDPTGASVTANAALSLTGTSERSLLGGEATISRITFNPQTDLGSLLASSVQPASVSARPGVLTEGLRFDVRVRTAPQARLETALTRGLQAQAELRLRGDPARPVVLGQVLVNQGEVLFFGNRYTIDSGEITFANPARIEPIMKLDLQTKVRGVDVTMTLSGPINKLNVTYRSDPPLQLADIVGLLATGREPASAPGLVGARTAQSQSWEQAGATALMGQAIATPLSGRLQRFFGVSRLKIDPTISGTSNTPEARLTVEQQLSPSLTFTYITNLTRAQEQAIRAEWGFAKHWSVVAVREENGLFGVDFLYKKRFK